ncbi:MAG TPA: TetR/AcrR family transcriptional regulator [Rhizomicrobium sp.]|nr:TetR/AcrR family transcriptional regulator [Rhizomicrobium sp.]
MPRVLTETDIADFRERLCELATRIFVERGPANFNMRLLAAELGVSAMTPYRYFKDKDEILSAIRARAFSLFADQLEGALATPGTPPEKSAAVGRAYIRFALEEQTCYRLMFDFTEPKGPQVPELAHAEMRARATMTDHVRMMIDAGYFEGDPELIGHIFWASLHGVMVLHLAGKLDGDVDRDTLLAEMGRVLRNAYLVRRPVSV